MTQNLTLKRFPYILKRGGGYTFRYIFPNHVLGAFSDIPKELRRTLRTDSYTEAVCLVSRAIPIIQQIKQCRDTERLHRLCIQLITTDFNSGLGFHPENVNPNPVTKPVSPILSEVWSQFVQWKHWNPRIVADNQRMFDNLLFFIGDRPVGEIGKRHLKTALERVSQLPQRNKKQYKGVSLNQLSRMDIPADDRVSSKFVKEHLKLCQSLFSRYLVKEIDILSSSPTDGLKWEYDNHRYACLADSDIQKALSNAENKPEWFLWFLRIAVYSGARRSEIANLSVGDFKVDADSGRNYFVIKEGKTKAAVRCVPIHQTLIDLGLLKWVSGQQDLLFPLAASNPTRATDLFKSIIGKGLNDIGERITLHSVRHTFITKARSAGVSDALVQQVVGHEKRGAGVTDRYTHTFPLASVAKVVDCITY